MAIIPESLPHLRFEVTEAAHTPLRHSLRLDHSQSSMMGIGSQVFRADMLLVRRSTTERCGNAT